MFNAYNDMRKKLGDVRNEIAIIGRKNHDAEQTIKRFSIVFLLFVYILRKMIFTTLGIVFWGKFWLLGGDLGEFFVLILSVVRLRVELEDWKSQNNKMQEELSQVKAQAEEMERKVEESKAENQQLTDTKETLVTEGGALTVKLEKLLALNKYIKLARVML